MNKIKVIVSLLVIVCLFETVFIFCNSRLNTNSEINVNPDQETIKTSVDVSMFDFPKNGSDVYEDLQKVGCKIFEGDYLLPKEVNNAIRIPSYKTFLYLAHGNIVILSQKVWKTGVGFKEGKGYASVSDQVQCYVITENQTFLWEYVWTEEISPEEVDEWIEERKIEW